MSMNLAFEIVGKGSEITDLMDDGYGYIDFPYQTTTDISNKVLRAKNEEEQLTIIREDLISNDWNKREIDKALKKIKTLMNMTCLKLVII